MRGGKRRKGTHEPPVGCEMPRFCNRIPLGCVLGMTSSLKNWMSKMPQTQAKARGYKESWFH